MATIQIRDLSEHAYEVVRRRARELGMSIQAYMREVVEDMASRPTKAEAIREIEGTLDSFGGIEADADLIARDVAADRR